MNKQLKQGVKLAQQIEEQYNLLEGDSVFFDLFHDDLRIQSDCAWEVVDELEEYSENPKKQFGQITGKEGIEITLDQLNDTLIYVTAVIKLQAQFNDLPRAIYG